jgi:hypothetical protein
MDRQLSPAEKRLVEREFVARQEAAGRRRSLARRLFLIGLSAGLGAAALREFHVGTIVTALLEIVWVICTVAYVGVGVFPASFSKDIDPRWHLNPWQAALRNLSEGRTQFEAIALLAGPLVAQMLFSFLYFGFK